MEKWNKKALYRELERLSGVLRIVAIMIKKYPKDEKLQSIYNIYFEIRSGLIQQINGLQKLFG